MDTIYRKASDLKKGKGGGGLVKLHYYCDSYTGILSSRSIVSIEQ